MSKECTAKLGPDTLLNGNIIQLEGSEKPVHAFLGVPYAKPPVGKLRFKRPEPLDLWTGSRDAKEFGPICPQVKGFLLKMLLGGLPYPEKADEDCLYLNVWTPSLDQEAKLPVMVWLHGGGFVYGCSNNHNGSAMASRHGVVFISINYRLGPFGFMCLGDETAPGNMGLLDQLEALKWVQANIKSFGGDPDNVTLFGESVGSVSAGMHTVSKLSEGLFHKTIHQSGPVLHPMWLRTKATAKMQVMNRLKAQGFEGSSSEDVISFLEGKDQEWIAKSLEGGFTPVVDGYFLTEDPKYFYERGDYYKVPSILGFNSHEGALFPLMSPNKGKFANIEAAKTHTKWAMASFYEEYKNVDKISDLIWDFYCEGEPDLDNLLKKNVDYLGDLMFVGPSVMIANIHQEYKPTYLYKYEHRWSQSTQPDWVTASHLEEIDIALGRPFYDENKENWTEEERKFSDLIMTYWTNFAKTSDPNGGSLPEWPKYKEDSKKLFNFKTNPEILEDHNPKAMQFWNVTVKKLLEGN